MKALINNTNEYVWEMTKRTLYTLQVLVLLVSIPVLFLAGMSNHGQKKLPEQNVKEITNYGQLMQKTITFPVNEM